MQLAGQAGCRLTLGHDKGAVALGNAGLAPRQQLHDTAGIGLAYVPGYGVVQSLEAGTRAHIDGAALGSSGQEIRIEGNGCHNHQHGHNSSKRLLATAALAAAAGSALPSRYFFFHDCCL